jgi:sugar lactone lactonase YvrE
MHRILAILLLFPLFTSSQVITTIAGNDARGKGGNGGPATNSQLNQPIALTVDDSGNIYIIDAGNDDIRKVSPDGVINIFASAKASKPHGIVAGSGGNLFYTENANNVVRVVTADGTRATIAGIRGTPGYSFHGDKSATNATLDGPNGITTDKHGNLFFADGRNNRIRCISKEGTISTIAGTGNPGYSGDYGKASRAQINMPWGVAVDESGNIFFTDMANNVIRKIDAEGIISTIGGNSRKGYDGDKGAATNASLNEPRGIAIDHSGNIYFADSRNDAVRMINSKGIITTYAGNGRRLFHIGDTGVNVVAYIPDDGHHGDGGPATKAQLYWPYDVALDANGNLYIADATNHVVRKVTVSKAEQSKSSVTRMSIPKTDLHKAETLKLKTTIAEPTKIEIPKIELTKLDIQKLVVEKTDLVKPAVLKVTMPYTELTCLRIPAIELPRPEIPREDITKATTLKIKTLKTEIVENKQPAFEVPRIELPRPEIPHEEIAKAIPVNIKTLRTEITGNQQQLFEVPLIELPHPEIPREDITKATTLKIKTFKTELVENKQPSFEVPRIELPRPEIPPEDITKVNPVKIKTLKTEIVEDTQPVFEIPLIKLPRPDIPQEDLAKITTIKLKSLKTEIAGYKQPEFQVPLIELPRPEIPREEIPKVRTIRIQTLKTEITGKQPPVFDVSVIEFPKVKPSLDTKKGDDAFSVSADAENETLTITVDSGAYAIITITDINDKVLIEKSIRQTKTVIDISALLPAHYFINLKDGAKFKTAMFVKDK